MRTGKRYDLKKGISKQTKSNLGLDYDCEEMNVDNLFQNDKAKAFAQSIEINKAQELLDNKLAAKNALEQAR